MIDIAQLRLEPGAETSVEVPVAVPAIELGGVAYAGPLSDRKSTRLNSSHT